MPTWLWAAHMVVGSYVVGCQRPCFWLLTTMFLAVVGCHGERSVCCFRKKKNVFLLFPTWLPLCIKVVVGNSEICWHGVKKICIKLILLKTEFEQKTCYTTTLFSIHFMFYIGILWYYGGPMGLNIMFYHANPWPVSGASGTWVGRDGSGKFPKYLRSDAHWLNPSGAPTPAARREWNLTLKRFGLS